MPVAPATDLIARCLAHDEGAWREFLQRYSRLIYSSIIKVGLPAEEKDEAFQAAVAAIYRQLPRLRDPEKLTSWIIGISWRQAINCIRSRSREVALEDVETAGSKALPSMTASQPLPDEERVMLERAQQAAEAMAGLTPRCRRLLSILFYDTVLHAQLITAGAAFCSSIASTALMDLAVRATPAGSEGLGFSLMVSVRNLALFGSNWVTSAVLDKLHVPISDMVLASAGVTALAVPLVFLLPAALAGRKEAEGLVPVAEPATQMQE